MRVLPGTGTWMGLQGWARSRVTPKQWVLASFRAKPSPLRGWAGWPICLLILLSPGATGWSSLWSPVGILLLSQPGLQCPRVWPCGPLTDAFYHRGCHCAIMGRGLEVQARSCWFGARVGPWKGSTFRTFHQAAAACMKCLRWGDISRPLVYLCMTISLFLETRDPGSRISSDGLYK